MAGQDKYFGAPVSLSDPANEGYAANKHPTDPLTNGVPRFIYVGTKGDLVCKLQDSAADVTYKNAEGFMPIRPSHIRATSTAADIVCHY